MRTREEIIGAIEEHEGLSIQARQRRVTMQNIDDRMTRCEIECREDHVASALRWVLGGDQTVQGLKDALKSVGVEKDLTLFVPRGIKVRIYD